jgi:hypothetical protein
MKKILKTLTASVVALAFAFGFVAPAFAVDPVATPTTASFTINIPNQGAVADFEGTVDLNGTPYTFTGSNEAGLLAAVTGSSPTDLQIAGSATQTGYYLATNDAGLAGYPGNLATESVPVTFTVTGLTPETTYTVGAINLTKITFKNASVPTTVLDGAALAPFNAYISANYGVGTISNIVTPELVVPTTGINAEATSSSTVALAVAGIVALIGIAYTVRKATDRK